MLKYYISIYLVFFPLSIYAFFNIDTTLAKYRAEGY